MIDKIPTESDWENYQEDIDCLEAYNLFEGKDTNSLTSLFVESVGRCIDGLHFMPTKVFHYYGLAFANYVKQAETLPGLQNEDRAKAAEGLFSLVENKLHIAPADLVAIYPELIETLNYVAQHQANYFVDHHKGVDFKSRLVIFNALAKESHII